ncbi:hypothetical protein ACIBKX_33415 [Streptomyces sp. NPDC050658]|uniref:hypothetical protein n=1 Tax=unclassified Streptomyces TaxID=2593676 RepID=UPI00341F38C1
MTTSVPGAEAPTPLGSEAEAPTPLASEPEPSASARPRKRTPNWGLLTLSLAVWLLVAAAVWSRRGLVRARIEAQQPPVDPEFKGVATASGLVVICLGFAVALLLVQFLAGFTDRWIARLWVPEEDGAASITARLSVGLTALAALVSYVWTAEDTDRFGSALPLWCVPLVAVIAHLPDAKKWSASATPGKAVSAAVAVALSACVLMAMGR